MPVILISEVTFFQVYLRRTEGTFSLIYRNPQWIPHSVKKSKEELG